jgi:hypothetical protein
MSTTKAIHHTDPLDDTSGAGANRGGLSIFVLGF